VGHKAAGGSILPQQKGTAMVIPILKINANIIFILCQKYELCQYK
jgi:hypothetical protein